MKKYIVIFLTSALLLSSCTIDWNDQKDKKISELEKQIASDLFKKRQECEKYRNTILKSNDWSSFQEIFYSPKRKTCVVKFASVSGKPAITFAELKDYLSGEDIIMNFDLNCVPDDINKDPEQNKVCHQEAWKFWSTYEELKWE